MFRPPPVRTRFSVSGRLEDLPPWFLGRFLDSWCAIQRKDGDYARWLPSTYNWTGKRVEFVAEHAERLEETPFTEQTFEVSAILLQRLGRSRRF